MSLKAILKKYFENCTVNRDRFKEGEQMTYVNIKKKHFGLEKYLAYVEMNLTKLSLLCVIEDQRDYQSIKTNKKNQTINKLSLNIH